MTVEDKLINNQQVNHDKAQPILVTGATGNVGRAVVQSLSTLGYVVRATTLDKQKAINVPEVADEIVFFEFGKSETYPTALAGVKKMFLMRPPAISDVKTYIKPVIEYATAVGIEHIAFLSLMGVEKRSYTPHYKIEKLIEASGVPYTFLRAGFFMQNLGGVHRVDIIKHDTIFIPAGDAKTAFIDVRDVGAVAAHVLTTPGHEKKAYELTGNEALTYHEVAAIFTDVLGRKISYSRPSLLHFIWHMRRLGHAWTYIAITSGLYLATRWGAAAQVTGEVKYLLGRDPLTMRQYVTDYATIWQPALG